MHHKCVSERGVHQTFTHVVCVATEVSLRNLLRRLKMATEVPSREEEQCVSWGQWTLLLHSAAHLHLSYCLQRLLILPSLPPSLPPSLLSAWRNGRPPTAPSSTCSATRTSCSPPVEWTCRRCVRACVRVCVRGRVLRAWACLPANGRTIGCKGWMVAQPTLRGSAPWRHGHLRGCESPFERLVRGTF